MSAFTIKVLLTDTNSKHDVPLENFRMATNNLLMLVMPNDAESALPLVEDIDFTVLGLIGNNS